jgi:putative endonuclease
MRDEIHDAIYNCRLYFVYLLASKRHGTLYCGVTNDLLGRVYQHKTKTEQGFTARYNVTRLVWFESHELINNAITREKRIKRWRRAWKIELIEHSNPQWRDLYFELGGADPDEIVPAGLRMRERHR